MTGKIVTGVIVTLAAGAIIWLGKRALSGAAAAASGNVVGPNFTPRTSPPDDLIEV